jgi:hypothetical protein
MNGISRRFAISPVRISWRIFPGSASRKSSLSSACRRARYLSVPLAIFGCSESAMSDVQIESRPNGHEYHGIPAYGTRPSFVFVHMRRRSADARSSSELRLSLDVKKRVVSLSQP